VIEAAKEKGVISDTAYQNALVVKRFADSILHEAQVVWFLRTGDRDL